MPPRGSITPHPHVTGSVKKNTIPHIQQLTSSGFGPFLTLIRAPLPTQIAKTVGTSSYMNKSPLVHFLGLISSFSSVGIWSYGRWPCVRPHRGGIFWCLPYSLNWWGSIARWYRPRCEIDTTWRPPLLCLNAFALHERRGVEQVLSSCLVCTWYEVGLLRSVVQNQQWVNGGTSISCWAARSRCSWLCLYQTGSHCNVVALTDQWDDCARVDYWQYIMGYHQIKLAVRVVLSCSLMCAMTVMGAVIWEPSRSLMSARVMMVMLLSFGGGY